MKHISKVKKCQYLCVNFHGSILAYVEIDWIFKGNVDISSVNQRMLTLTETFMQCWHTRFIQIDCNRYGIICYINECAVCWKQNKFHLLSIENAQGVLCPLQKGGHGGTTRLLFWKLFENERCKLGQFISSLFHPSIFIGILDIIIKLRQHILIDNGYQVYKQTCSNVRLSLCCL